MSDVKRKLASIQKIVDISEIPGADAIELEVDLGWHVVTKKGEFKIGDYCVYFEIDSLLPMRKEFDFLAVRGTKKTLVDEKLVEGYRLKTIKLRGQVSQGLALPVDIILSITGADGQMPQEGVDVTELLGVYKYEPPMPGNLQGIAKGVRPSDIPKTDEVRLQTAPFLLERYSNEEFYVTEKVDGRSVTVFYKDKELNVCSRSMNWNRESDNSYWKSAIAAGLDESGSQLTDIVLQGELVGEGIQGNKLNITGQKILFFNAYNRATGQYLGYEAFRKVASVFGLETVPIISQSFDLRDQTVDSLVEFATRKSLINKDVWVEGIVIRPLLEVNDINIGRLSFKVINPRFLLKYD